MTTSTASSAHAEPPGAPAVRWYATWECHTCGDGGDAHFDDGTIVDSGHDCADGDVAWGGRADCTCGWSLESDFEDGDYVEADHDCPGDG